MKIGFVGLGKLGLPCALAIESKGHEVRGVDISPAVVENIKRRQLPYLEEQAPKLLKKSRITAVELKPLLKWAEIVFVAVQTPHEPRYEGVTRLPCKRIGFDYSWLKQAVASISRNLPAWDEVPLISVISTVLPTTMDTEILPLLDSRVPFCYNPYFIAMGTTIDDFLHPEFTLIGSRDCKAGNRLARFYKTIHNAPCYVTGIGEAEATKVFYNTFISGKLAFANVVMETCARLGLDCDAVTDALKLATERVISPAYLSGGMGDGGGCHPRDNIALSWLARKLELSYDWFNAIMSAREAQTDWLADVIQEHMRPNDHVVILGKAFKAGSNITTGSAAILLRNLLAERGIEAAMYDPHIDTSLLKASPNTLFFIGTKHREFVSWPYPAGSIVIDPWRYIPDVEDVTVIRIGEGKPHVGQD